MITALTVQFYITCTYKFIPTQWLTLIYSKMGRARLIPYLNLPIKFKRKQAIKALKSMHIYLI